MQSHKSYLKTDEGKIINEDHIRWAKQMEECSAVCTKSIGCASDGTIGDTHKICKAANPESYAKLKSHFEK